jgi:hypothetical protein
MMDTHVTSKDNATLNLDNNVRYLTGDLSVVLKDFPETAMFMSSESYVSCSDIYPIVFDLLN